MTPRSGSGQQPPVALAATMATHTPPIGLPVPVSVTVAVIDPRVGAVAGSASAVAHGVTVTRVGPPKNPDAWPPVGVDRVRPRGVRAGGSGGGGGRGVAAHPRRGPGSLPGVVRCRSQRTASRRTQSPPHPPGPHSGGMSVSWQARVHRHVPHGGVGHRRPRRRLPSRMAPSAGCRCVRGGERSSAATVLVAQIRGEP